MRAIVAGADSASELGRHLSITSSFMVTLAGRKLRW
jgi:hypothetical protein